ncbi:hypothetical protein ACTOJ1_001582 [Shigella flexneri]
MNTIHSLEQMYKEEKENALSFLEWQEGWDGYSAKKIDKQALFKQFIAFDMCLKAELPMPNIIPNSAGLVELTWSNKGNEAYIIYDNDDGYLLCSLGKGKLFYDKEYKSENDLILDEGFISIIKNYFSLSEMYSALSRLEDLKKIENGWDGKEALAMSEKTYKNILRFIKSRITGGYSIFLNYEGEVLIEFFDDEKMEYISFEIGENVWRIYEDEQEYIFNNALSFLGKVRFLVNK